MYVLYPQSFNIYNFEIIPPNALLADSARTKQMQLKFTRQNKKNQKIQVQQVELSRKVDQFRPFGIIIRKLKHQMKKVHNPPTDT